MCRLFAFITCIVIIAGAVIDNGIKKVKRGGNFPLFVSTSEPKMVSLRKVQKNGTQEIFRYCSIEEQNHGCKPINSGRISLRIRKEKFSLTFLDANTSDEGVYDFEVIDDKNYRIKHNYSVSLTEQPFTTPAISTKGEETLGTNGPTTKVNEEQNHKITWGIIGGLSGVTAVVIGIICYKKKKQNNHIADEGTEDPGEDTSLNSNTNGAGEPDTDESLEMVVVDTNFSVDNKEGPELGA